MTVTLDPFADLRTMPGEQRLFKLLAPFHASKDGKPFVIPAGFFTDLASIPNAAEWFIQNDAPTILRGALGHDFFYQYAGHPPGCPFSVTRAEADEFLREAMAVCGASWSQRWTVWGAVRVGGFNAWKPHALALRALDLRAKIRRSTNISKAIENIK